MKTSPTKKALALFLVLMLMLSSVSMLASAASGYTPTGDFYKISETEYKIAPGVTENRVIVNKTTGNQQEMVYAVTVDAAAKATTSFMAGYADYNGKKWKMQKVRDQAVAAERETGANIVAAYNADIFNMQTGEPTGCLIMGGNIYKEGLGRPYFGVTKNGDYVMGESLTADVLATLREGVSGFYMIVKNGKRTGPGKNPESNIAPKTAIGFKADGSVVCVVVDGRNFPISSNLSDYDLATIMLDLGCVDVLNLDGGGSTTYLAKYEGKSVLELANRPSDAVERAVASALFITSSAKPSGVFDHASLSPNNTLYTPNSTVTFSAIGVDSAGESAPLPDDGAFVLADDSAALGVITEDGVFTASDATGVVNVNYVSGGEVVGSTFIEIATPDELYIPSEEYSLDFDETTDFSLVAKNAGRTIEIKDGDLVWSKAPELREMQQFTYQNEAVSYSNGIFYYAKKATEQFAGSSYTRERFTGTNVLVSQAEAEQTFTGTGDTTVFMVSDQPSTGSTFKVYVDDALQTLTTHYTYNKNGTLTFVTAPANDAAIKVVYPKYTYACTLAGKPMASAIYYVKSDSLDAPYEYDAETGVLTLVTARKAGSNKIDIRYYNTSFTLAEPTEGILVKLDDSELTSGYTYDPATGVLLFDEPHSATTTIEVDKVLTPAQAEDLTASLMGSFEGNTFKAASINSCTGAINVASAYDETVTASTTAVIGAAPVMLYDFEYTTDAEEAANSGGRLQWIPTYELPTFDRLNEMGQNPDNKSHTAFAAEWYEQGYPLYSWPNASLGYGGMKSTVVSAADGEPVRFGDHSLRMDVNWESYVAVSNSNNYLRVTSPDYRFEGAPKKIGAWIYVPEGMANFALNLNCCDNNGNIVSQCVSNVNAAGDTCENWVGWKYVEMDLTNSDIYGSSNIGPTHYPYGFYQGCGIFWASFQPGKSFGSRSASTIYIDNIQLIYSANTDDTKNPEVTSIAYDTLGAPEEFVNNSTVLTDNTVTIRASFQDAEDKYATGINPDAVYMSIDGVDVTDKAYVNAADGQIYFYDAELNDGVHSVSVTVYDNFGNKTTDTRFFTVAGSSPATVELVAEDAAPVLGLDYTLAVKAADASDVIGADIDVHTFAAFTYFYDNMTVVPAEGYKLAEPFKYDSTNAIVSFKLEKDGSAVPADGVIARIVYSIPSNVRSDSIDVRFRVDKGGVTYASDKGEKYLGSFGGSVSGSCIAPLVVSCDTFLVGQGGYFYVRDLDGNPVEGAQIVYDNGAAVSDELTDADGKLYTEAFKDEVTAFNVRAEKDGLISFYFAEQSYPSGGSDDGMPTSIALNGAKDGSSQINVTWYASPFASADKAVAWYATKADFEANGDAAFQVAEGRSRLEELASSGNKDTNYALRFNKVVISGLQPQTEYVYKVGDGEKMSDARVFKTGKFNIDTNFFIIGDMQDEDTSNLDAILDALDKSETSYDFGLQTGDAVDNGGKYSWWVNVASIFSNGYLSTRPIVHVLGNHEYYGDYEGENSADYFGMETEDGAAPLAYSTTYGNVYIAVINYSDFVENYEEAIEWVKNDATTNSSLWKILAIHQPAYYTNPGGGNRGVNALIPPLVDELGFNFVFSGHDHSYVRTYPVTNGVRDDADGAVYYICGSTGEKSYAVVENPDFPYAFVRGSQALEGEYEAIYLTASTTDTTMTVDTHEVTVNGDSYTDEIIDSYTMTKAITCGTNGDHVYSYALDGTMTCTVCGYSKQLGNYTGFATDEATGKTRYFINGNGQVGWLNYDQDCYYFDENGLAVSAGDREIDGITYTFDSEGKQVGGAFVKVPEGYTRCYRGGSYLTSWNDIDGYTYFFSTSSKNPGKMLTGRVTIRIYTGQEITYKFDKNGHLLDYVLVDDAEGKRYYWGQTPQTGWQTINGKQYYFDLATALMVTDEVEIDGQTYAFNADGTFAHEGAHEYGEPVHTDAKCFDPEKNTWTCSICGSKKVEELSPAFGSHIDEDGNKLCDRCGKYTGNVSSWLEPLFRIFYWIVNAVRSLFHIF